MLTSSIVQDASNVGSSGIKIVFLTAYDVSVNFFGNLAKVIESATASING